MDPKKTNKLNVNYSKVTGNPGNNSIDYEKTLNNGKTTIYGSVSGTVGYPKYNTYNVGVTYNINDSTSVHGCTTFNSGGLQGFNIRLQKYF